ncbi:MAG: riboflavin synthase [Bacteroidota bacterium]
MFTGIIERTGRVEALHREGTNVRFAIRSPLGPELRVDQSVSHNGVCLTVTSVHDEVHEVVAIDETLQKSNLGSLKTGSIVNLERCMAANGRFDGHIVQGHVDTTGKVMAIHDKNGSWQFDFLFPSEFAALIVEKGSVCINGVSLTCFNCGQDLFSVAIIPYTWELTTFRDLQPGDAVNLEFDIVGKYVRRLVSGA